MATCLLEIYKELQKEDENGKLPDIVLGSRFMEGSSGFSVSFAKKIAFVWFRIMLKTGTGRRITDEIYLAVRTPAQWRTLRSEKEFRQKKYAHLALFDDGIP